MNRHLVVAAFLTCLDLCGNRRRPQPLKCRSRRNRDHRIRSLLYVPDQVVRLRGWVGYHVDLEFEPGESFVTLGGGDLAGLIYGAYSNHLVLKPKAPTASHEPHGVHQQAHLCHRLCGVGRAARPVDRRTRVFACALTIHRSRVQHCLKRLRRILPPRRARDSRTWTTGIAATPCLQPVAVSDDGVHTRLRFGPSAELPAIFVRSDDGSESLLNYSMEGPDMVIHRLARHFILRRGKLVGCVTNKGFIGSGERLESGTVSPQVHRQTREILP